MPPAATAKEVVTVNGHELGLAGPEGCDAGDEAFVARVVPFLLGRRLVSTRELDLLTRIVRKLGRAELVRGLMRTAEFLPRARALVMDVLQVNRASVRANGDCYGTVSAEAATSELATFVRDHRPDAAEFKREWTFAELLESCVKLGDLSPFLRAYLFGLVALPVLPKWNKTLEYEARQNWANVFLRTYLNRDLACMTCHNSESSVTGHPDPNLDRTWEIPGHFERALFGRSTGIESATIGNMFRQHDILRTAAYPDRDVAGSVNWYYADGVAPWGMAFDCGRFQPPAERTDDPRGSGSYFISDHGLRGTVWEIESALDQGFKELRGTGHIATGDASKQGTVAFASLVSLSLVNAIWREAHGQPLVIANYFPRNRFQRDVMRALADRFVESGYSLAELIVGVVTHSLYNQTSPSACGSSMANGLPPILDPWTVSNEDPSLRSNGVGETIHHADPRLLQRALATALRWTEPAEFFPRPDPNSPTLQLLPEARFQRDIGVFLMDSERGFRGSGFMDTLAWESGYAACVDPAHFEEDGRSRRGGTPPDAIDALVQAGAPTSTLADLAMALKDRLITDPDLSDADERALVEALFGQPLDTRVSDAVDPEGGLRRLCGALVVSPQFLLVGGHGPTRAEKRTTIVLEGESWSDLCTYHATKAFPATGMTCKDDDVIIP